MRKRRSVDSLAVEMLLDNDQAGLTRLANNLKQQLAVVMGDKCPLCGGKNVAIGGDGERCFDCDEIYDLPVTQNYDEQGNPVDEFGNPID